MSPEAPPRVLLAENLTSGVILHLDRVALEHEVVELVFPLLFDDDPLPPGVVLEPWRGRLEQWHLVLPGSAFDDARSSVLRQYLRAVPYDPAGALALAQEERRRTDEYERWLDTVHPVLGRTPREELADPGWREANGHLIWSGTDLHEFHQPLQMMELSEYASVNEDVRYYLRRGQSLHDAVRSAIRTGMAQLRAAAFIVADMPDLALIELERIEERDDTEAFAQVERELAADRAAIERALRAAVRRSP
ncbi:hypothetical protein ACL02T_26840 [Pseudonocardia sp. RS010]|uniref:hypothetical protein n=1 Tax=Pseudonocardia sp. RS010 TaxID=3385979 RepID=UPI0039A1C56E